MARNLYRFYLYTVFIAMLIFAAVGLGRLLQPLLKLTPLRGMYGTSPSNADIVQAGVFFAVSWIIAILLGGLHYWLIRRDMHNDPSAGVSAIRAFFLNISELIAAPLAIGTSALAVIDELGHVPMSDVTGAAALAIATLVLLGVLEWERERTQAGMGAAMAFQRLHLYGVQLILLILLTFSWLSTVGQLVDAIAFGGKAMGFTPCGGFIGCAGPNLLSSVAATLWIVLFWIGYGYFARSDTSSLLRRILHFASFAYGAGFLLYGIRQGIELGFLSLFGVSVPPNEVLNSYNFTAFITFGLLVLGIYTLWLRIAARQHPPQWVTTILIAETISATLLAGSFYWGVALVLLHLFELPATSNAWASALALVITGIAYVLLDIHLHRRKVQGSPSATDARRGFVFALLGGGILAAAIGGAIALYALLTSALGSPFNDWPHVARSGASAFAAGVVILTIYLWITNREHLFSGLLKRAAQVEPSVHPEPVTKPTPIEDVLDELLAGKISRDEAASRIRDMK